LSSLHIPSLPPPTATRSLSCAQWVAPCPHIAAHFALPTLFIAAHYTPLVTVHCTPLIFPCPVSLLPSQLPTPLPAPGALPACRCPFHSLLSVPLIPARPASYCPPHLFLPTPLMTIQDGRKWSAIPSPNLEISDASAPQHIQLGVAGAGCRLA
jgi:hypothetical protein